MLLVVWEQWRKCGNLRRLFPNVRLCKERCQFWFCHCRDIIFTWGSNWLDIYRVEFRDQWSIKWCNPYRRLRWSALASCWAKSRNVFCVAMPWDIPMSQSGQKFQCSNHNDWRCGESTAAPVQNLRELQNSSTLLMRHCNSLVGMKSWCSIIAMKKYAFIERYAADGSLHQTPYTNDPRVSLARGSLTGPTSLLPPTWLASFHPH